MRSPLRWWGCVLQRVAALFLLAWPKVGASRVFAAAVLLSACRLLGTFGGEDLPCCGFGFGDAVIVELLKETNKLPVFKQQVWRKARRWPGRADSGACSRVGQRAGRERLLCPRCRRGAVAQVEDLVVALDESLRSAASGVAQQLRRAGRKVELVLEAKKMKVVFKVSEGVRLGFVRTAVRCCRVKRQRCRACARTRSKPSG